MTKISRKEHFRRSVTWGGCCGVALLASSMPAVSVEADKREGAFTPCEYRAKEGQDVFKRIITQLDQKLDKATMGEIMESCGRLCYDGANPNPQRATPEEASRFMEGMRDHLGKDGVQFKFQKNRIRLVKSQLII